MVKKQKQFLVERMEDAEKKNGIIFEGIYTYVEDNSYDDTENFECIVNGEIIGEKLNNDINIKVAAFDNYGKVLGERTEYISELNFFQYDTFSISFNVKEIPYKFKIFPIRSR